MMTNKFLFPYRNEVSFIFRAILITYAIIVINIYPNYFESYIYYSLIPIYVVLYFTLLVYNRSNERSKLGSFLSLSRLTIDFIFIFFILYGKNIDNIFVLLFVFLPIFNYSNHSGIRQTLYPFIYTLILLIIFDSERWIINTLSVIILLVLFEIDVIRYKFIQFNNDLLLILNNLKSSLRFDKAYNLYEFVLNLFKQLPKYFNLHIDALYLFHIVENKIYVMNGTEFVQSFFFVDERKILDLFSSQKSHIVSLYDTEIVLMENTEVYINQNRSLNNDILFYEEYFFLLIRNSIGKKKIYNYYLSNILLPLLIKIVDVFKSEESLRKDKILHFQRVMNNYEYINRAILAMHLLNNKFSPISSYFQIHEKIKLTSGIQREKLQKILNREEELAKITIGEILTTAKKILDNSENPLILNDIQTRDARNIFTILLNVWDEYFDIRHFDSWPDLSNYQLKLSQHGLAIIFHHIIDNMKKYNNGEFKIDVTIVENDLILIFKNNILKEKQHEIKKIIEAYNSENYSKLYIANSHGLQFNKHFLAQLSANALLSLEDNYFIMKLTFPLIKAGE